MAITGGFFNSLNGDRKYYADEFNSFFEGLVGAGVFESVGDALQVNAVVTNLKLQVSVLPGKLTDSKGRWLKNDAVLNLELEPADVLFQRYDAVVAAIDSSTPQRLAKIYIKKGTSASNPVTPTMTRTETLEEYCLAYVYVGKNATTIRQSDVTDTRADKNICGWVTGLIEQVNTTELFRQYQDAYERDRKNNQSNFDYWFNEVKEKFASATLMRSYERSYISSRDWESEIPIGMDRYNKELDILHVYINGLKLVSGEEYTINSNESITLTTPIDAGTPVNFVIYKSVDMENVESVVGNVDDLLEWANEDNKYIYRATGADDNIKLSEICQKYISGTGLQRRQIKIEVVGKRFDIGEPVSGNGTDSDRYKYLEIGSKNTDEPRTKIILDFGKCEIIEKSQFLENSIIFSGENVQIENMSAKFISMKKNMTFVESKVVNFKNCDVIMQGYGTVCFARMWGDFENCTIDVSSSDGDAYCFAAGGKGCLRVVGCKCTARTSESKMISAAGYSPVGENDSILLMTNCYCLKNGKGGLELNSIKIDAGKYALYGNVVHIAPSIGDAANGVENGTILLSEL